MTDTHSSHRLNQQPKKSCLQSCPSSEPTTATHSQVQRYRSPCYIFSPCWPHSTSTLPAVSWKNTPSQNSSSRRTFHPLPNSSAIHHNVSGVVISPALHPPPTHRDGVGSSWGRSLTMLSRRRSTSVQHSSHLRVDAKHDAVLAPTLLLHKKSQVGAGHHTLLPSSLPMPMRGQSVRKRQKQNVKRKTR